MSRKFVLKLTGIECVEKQPGEIGKDEILLLGFGITDGGEPVMFGPTPLGSYKKDDRNKIALPITLVEKELGSAHTSLFMQLILIEQDMGKVHESHQRLRTHFVRTVKSTWSYLQSFEPSLTLRQRGLWSLDLAMKYSLLEISRVATVNYGNSDDIESIQGLTFIQHSGLAPDGIARTDYSLVDRYIVYAADSHYLVDFTYHFPRVIGTQ